MVSIKRFVSPVYWLWPMLVSLSATMEGELSGTEVRRASAENSSLPAAIDGNLLYLN